MRGAQSVIWGLLAGTVASKTASFMSMPFLTLFLAMHAHVSPWVAGIIVGLSPLATLVGGFVGGQLSDVMGRSTLLIGSLVGMALSYLGLAVGGFMQEGLGQLVVLGLFNLINGWMSACYQPVSQALMSDLVPIEDHYKFFQLRYTAINIGAAIGPLLGAWFGMSASPIAFVYTGIVYMLYAGIMWYFLPVMRPIDRMIQHRAVTLRRSIQVLSRDRKLRYFLVAGTLFTLCFSQIDSSFAQYLQLNFVDGVHLFSCLLSVNGFAVLALQAPVILLTKRWSPMVSMLVGSLIFAAGMAILGFHHISHVWLYVSILLLSLGEIFVFPVSAIFVDRMAPENMRGTYFGASSLRQCGFAIGPFIGGLCLTSLGSHSLFLIMAAIACLSFVVNWWGERIEEGIRVPASAIPILQRE